MMREVATRRGGEFPRSMSDLKPGDQYRDARLVRLRKFFEVLYPEIFFPVFNLTGWEHPEECTHFKKTMPAQFKEAETMAVKEKIRIRLKGYDHNLVDKAAEKILETARRTGAQVSGPVPLPTEKEVVTILRAVHKYKDSREQFEQRTHKRLIDILRPSNKTVEALTGLELPAGVEIEIKL